MKNKNFTRRGNEIRLSKDVVPIKYNIQLKPDLDNFTFEGIETITLSVLKQTKVLTLHSKEIEIETASILRQKKKFFAKISYNEKKETATFVFPKNLEVLPPLGGRTSKLKLTIVFKGILNDKMRGFYRSKYTILDKEYYLATTQFEATDARRAFPCFDEPAQKAIFHVSLVVPKGKIAISNTLPISILEHDSGYQIVKFSPTPKMSTYLLAFIVGDFEYIESKTRNNIQVRLFTTPGKKHQAKFALDCAVKILEFYEKYFDIAYPLPVLDMIAIPDFTSGAMENWGAITYRESALLVDENHSSLSNKQWVALIIAHEIAHQWFGNLVTMEWWTHLWLNEGFASYIEYLAVDKLFPKWDIWTQFSTNELSTALRLDALLNTHPIEIPVHHPDEIGEIFDEVSYSKGASIIRMLANYLGEENFRDGLRYYLKKHSYKNTETFHLWQAFEKVSKKSIAKMMHNWTSKPGYPVIKAEIKNGKLNLSQERFFASPISKAKTKDKTIWQVPISVKNNDSWNKINFEETGFFRTAYSKELLEKLKIPVENKLLFARDRLGIIRDLFALAEAGTIPTTDALEFLSSYKKEDNYTVLFELAMGLGRLEQLLAKEKFREKLNSLILSLFSPLVAKLGWEKKLARRGKKKEIHTDTLLRSLAISRVGRSGDEKIIKEARKKFAKIRKGIYVNSDIRGAVYAVVASKGSMKEYKTFIKQYKKESLHEEKNRIGSALGDFRDPKILKQVCEFAFSDNVRRQDTIGIISSVGANPFGRNIWLNFVQKNWETLVSRYGDGGHTLARLVKAISGSAEEKHLKSFKKFFFTHDTPGAKRAIQQVLERLEGNVAWLKRDGKIIENFLKNNSV
ncbi:MAG: Puromycin-sensitive aminopeptidase [Candidatus Nomurabacteria bacterium GW2011_GWA1_37_20]|uniref:Aminopeptidase n=1 Tax=Candidatus Nomurabacteria bacterium GW2011_GWA1_37_20 TaxID=1618729 RepID=A0A0G0JVF8_9BACT|nr:MAG: Puromycin-sensitive aminopeptidase [Parcubacteria group bacterium GW2011_GWC1_36_9]KKQ28418.1 MAG: Puromycin-sensitive aminopeptidase [Parcubacteria group bacterium GW2011_GWB1_37_13]KKQ32291.1 MAG: Puromycin-sensitive aminopeptidase [Candidatus Nomurabacteria bacterium GW2011_GWA1_37_20]